MKKIDELLSGQTGSYIFPFFWQHGEDEETLRDYMRAIDGANIHAVCVECRPHPDFCGPKWWQDLDIILDEAHKRGMKVWILDDDHFPTGHANGAIADAPLELRPWYVDSVRVDCYGPSPMNRFDIHRAIAEKVAPKTFPGMPPMRPGQQKTFFENDEQLLSVTAWEIGDDGKLRSPRDVSEYLRDGVLVWDVPNGAYRLCATFLTHNGDGRTDYINILDHDSVRVLIDQVYEAHYARYPGEFGSTILGFFSDEPMVGNIAGMYQSARLGEPGKRLTNPWQKDLPAMLEKRLGADWRVMLPLLWEEGTREETARVRIAYMDAVTRLIEKNFAGQLATWCEEHGVEYIGHVWEDKHLSYALGGGLGHFFRAMHGNHMGGVDLVFTQMRPWSDRSAKDDMSGDFYYYVLGKLASSQAHFDPHKHGRALCEIFGASGWDFGVDKMKYLTDNFLVNGINRFVPHAFSPKAFPDPDCPPHFYAHGENAQYPSFAKLMEYAQRMCHLLSDGQAAPEAAVLYHAENDWVGALSDVKNRMYCDVPAKLLGRAQIDYDIVPVDLLADCLTPGENGPAIRDGRLTANGISYKALIVPASDFTSQPLVSFCEMAEEAGFPVFFLNTLPAAQTEARGQLVTEDTLIAQLRKRGIGEVTLSPASPSVKYYHYKQENDIYMFVNNDLGTPYAGTITLPNTAPAWIYDAYENVVRPVRQEIRDGKSRLTLKILAYNPVVVFFGSYEGEARNAPELTGEVVEVTRFTLRSCMAKDYPAFGEAVPVTELTDIAQAHPEVMDCYRYEAVFQLREASSVLLAIDYMSDGAEVFVNDRSCGRRIAPNWVYDLTPAVHPGENRLRIDMAATPARKVAALYPREGPVFSMSVPAAVKPEGIIGKVKLYIR